MRKVTILGFALCYSCLLILGCNNVTLFNKVQIKAAPSIYAPIGGKKIEVKDLLSAEKLSDLLGKNSQFKVYDYTGGQNEAMTFLMYYPVLNMPLNFDEYLGKLDMSQLNTSIPEVEFTIPKFDVNLESQIVGIPSGNSFVGKKLTEDEATALNSVVSESSQLSIGEREFYINSEGLVSATLASKNKIFLALTPTVEGISVSNVDISVTLPGSDEKVKFQKDANGTGYSADLSDKTIASGSFSIGGSISIASSMTAGTQIPEQGIGVTVDMELNLNEGFTSVTMEVPTGTDLKVHSETPFPEEMTKMVSSIKFNSIGANVTLNNGLPEGNDIEVTVSSSQLNFSNVTKTFVHGSSTQEFTGTNVTVKPSETSNLNIEMQVGLPGYDVDTDSFTVRNVKPEETYTVGGSVAFVVDWQEATIKTEKPYEGSYPATGEKPIDLSEIWSKVPEGISFQNLGAYLYLNAPLDKFQMKGYMKLNGDYVLGSEENEGILKKGVIPEIPSEGAWKSSLEPTQASCDFSEALQKVMENRPASLSFDYSLNADEVTIQKEQVQGEQSLSVVMIMTLPFDLKIDSSKSTPLVGNPFEGSGVFIDIFKLANINVAGADGSTDLFKREKPWSKDDELNKLLSQVQSMTLEVGYTNDLGMEMGAWLSDVESGISKFFSIAEGQGSSKITLDQTDVDRILNTYPFAPSVYIYLPDTTEGQDFILKKGGNIDFSLTVATVTDINYTYSFTEGK